MSDADEEEDEDDPSRSFAGEMDATGEDMEDEEDSALTQGGDSMKRQDILSDSIEASLGETRQESEEDEDEDEEFEDVDDDEYQDDDGSKSIFD